MKTIILDSVTKSIKAKLSAPAATTNPDFVAAWYDENDTLFIDGSTDGALNGITDVLLVASPAAATQRVIKAISIQNKDTAPVTVTVSYDNNGTQRTIAVVTLAVGDTWTLEGTYDANGNLKQGLAFPEINPLTEKITPLDADLLLIASAVDGMAKRKITWANLKATLGYITAASVAVLTGKTIEYPAAMANDHSWQGETITGTAGENLTIGQLVYFKSDGKWWLAKGDAYTTARTKGIATGTINANASGVILQKGTFRDDTWDWTVASALWLSAATAGAITETQPATTGNQIQYIGYALNADTLYFQPSNDIGEKA